MVDVRTANRHELAEEVLQLRAALEIYRTLTQTQQATNDLLVKSLRNIEEEIRDLKAKRPAHAKAKTSDGL